MLGSSQLYRWERIETPKNAIHNTANIRVAPSFTAGRGLKQYFGECYCRSIFLVAPSFTAGRGLKRLIPYVLCLYSPVAPSFTAGRGLKLYINILADSICTVAPSFTAGRGLKQNRCPRQ